ncbi:MAG: cation transporter [Halanaerobiaceae bacterium]|nr:cation transporter [Halanaerobiaceae bacterium]
MAHNDKQHQHHHHHHDGSTDNIKTAFFLNFSFAILEIIGGIWINSSAILSDALHDLGDSISLGLAFVLEKYSKKEADDEYSFGYSRFSLLAAFINSFVLITGSILILIQAVPRIFAPEPVNELGMVVFSLLGITVNGIAVLRLRRGNSINEEVVSWHLIEDILGWLAVLIVSIVLLFVDLYILDPLLSVIITIYILFNVSKNIRRIANIFLQRVPEGFAIEDIEGKFRGLKDVIDVHHTHIWSLDGEKHLLSTHIVVNKDLKQSDIINLKNRIRESGREMGISHITVEIDFPGEDCICIDCDY